MIRLELPLPPSVNHMYGRSGSRTFLSKEAHAFRADVYEQWLKQPRRKTLEGHVHLRVVIAPRNKGRCDVDGRMKALLDALQNCLVYHDDNQVTDLWVSKVDPAPPTGWCLVEIKEVLPR